MRRIETKRDQANASESNETKGDQVRSSANVSDVILSDATSPGSDIYVHGGCQTTGCIPLTNDKIQELYLLAVEAHEEGKSIPIHIFPTKKFEENLDEDDEHFSFWENLKPGFDFFEENKKLPTFKVNSEGEYTIQN